MLFGFDMRDNLSPRKILMLGNKLVILKCVYLCRSKHLFYCILKNKRSFLSVKFEQIAQIYSFDERRNILYSLICQQLNYVIFVFNDFSSNFKNLKQCKLLLNDLDISTPPPHQRIFKQRTCTIIINQWILKLMCVPQDRYNYTWSYIGGVHKLAEGGNHEKR